MKPINKFVYIVGLIATYAISIIMILIMGLVILQAIPGMILYFSIFAIGYGVFKAGQFIYRLFKD